MKVFKNILLVDDDSEDRELMAEAMSSVDADGILQFAQNGFHALELLEERYNEQNLPSLIVLDLNMPKMNGTETLEKLKSDARFTNIPVIVYSTSINPKEQKRCMELGAYEYISKPVSVEESRKIGKILLDLCDLG